VAHHAPEKRGSRQQGLVPMLIHEKASPPLSGPPPAAGEGQNTYGSIRAVLAAYSAYSGYR